MFSIYRASALIYLSLLWACTNRLTAAATDGSSALLEAFHRSELFRNLSADGEQNLLEHLRQIYQAPLKTRLKNIQELRYGDSGRAVRDIIQRFPKPDARLLPHWFDDVMDFLDKYPLGESPVEYGPVTVTLNRTALSGLPMIRRSLLAQLAAAWLTALQMDFPEGLVPRLEQLVRKLYGIHVGSVAQRAVMEYFHISKAGGTSWNSAAKLNGCVRSMSIGSHVRGFGDECRWMNQTVYTELTGGRRILWGRWGRVERHTKFHTCQERYAVVASRGFSYTSNEYTLVGGKDGMRHAHLCPHVVNVVTLRNPLRRMESNIRFIMMHIKVAYRRHISGGEEAFNKVFCNASGAFWQALAPPVTDNYVVRSFLGETAFHTPVGGLGREHVAAARDQLLQFDLVLDLDAGESTNDRMAQQALGWPAALSRAHALDSSVLSIRMDLNYTECHPNEEDMEALRQLQGPDLRFYGFGRVVSQLDALWLDMARALGLRPLAQELGPEAEPSAINCGLLWRRSNQSALVQALEAAGAPIVSSTEVVAPEEGEKPAPAEAQQQGQQQGQKAEKKEQQQEEDGEDEKEDEKEEDEKEEEKEEDEKEEDEKEEEKEEERPQGSQEMKPQAAGSSSGGGHTPREAEGSAADAATDRAEAVTEDSQ